MNAVIWTFLLHSDATAGGRVSVPAGAGSPLFLAVSLAFAVTALACVRMLWRLNVMAPAAFLVWAAIALASVLALDLDHPSAVSTAAVIDREWLVACIALGLLLLGIWFYIRRVVRQSENVRSNKSLDGARGG
jgi:hypothetical protein